MIDVATLPPHLASRIEVRDDCWEWTGSIAANGYGMVWHERRWTVVHRAVVSTVRVIPDGLVLDHLCRNRSCCNPDHLEAVPHVVNVRRGASSFASRDTCLKGLHALTPDNVIRRPSGRNACRQCKRDWANAHRAVRRAA